ncbi:MAG: YmdB family metallophosphoesterase [Arenicellales bacterium WSBS_2016_MAG_OTU3]
MNVLFIGDVVGKPGRRVLFANIATVQANYDIDFTIVNVENAAGGFGVTQSVLDEFLQHEINVMSSGKLLVGTNARR